MFLANSSDFHLKSNEKTVIFLLNSLVDSAFFQFRVDQLKILTIPGIYLFIYSKQLLMQLNQNTATASLPRIPLAIPGYPRSSRLSPPFPSSFGKMLWDREQPAQQQQANQISSFPVFPGERREGAPPLSPAGSPAFSISFWKPHPPPSPAPQGFLGCWAGSALNINIYKTCPCLFPPPPPFSPFFF